MMSVEEEKEAGFRVLKENKQVWWEQLGEPLLAFNSVQILN